MADYLELGPTPFEEDCVQVSKDDYVEDMKKEVRTYVHQLQRMFPQADIRMRKFSHDFGGYYEAIVVYDEFDEKSCEFAYMMDDQIPARWDKEALIELGRTQ